MDKIKKEAYQKKMEAKLAALKGKILGLEAELKSRQSDGASQLQTHLKTLRQRRETAQEKLHDLSQASETAWDDMKHGMAKAWDDLETAFTHAKDNFNH